MTTGLARTSIRSRPSAFAGVFVALTFSATVITTCVAMMVTVSGLGHFHGKADISDLAAALTGGTGYLTILMMGIVASLAVSQRERETALLRAIGARPWQVRRMVLTETLLCAVPATLVGYGLGSVLVHLWYQAMADRSMVPAHGAVTVGIVPLLVAFGVLCVTSLLGGLIAGQRASRSRPAIVMAQIAAPSKRMGRVRSLLSVISAGGAVALTIVEASLPVDKAYNTVPLVLLAYLVAIGLAGPLLGRMVTFLTWPISRTLGVVGELAVANNQVRSRRMSAAITPIAFAAGFAAAKLCELYRGGHGLSDADWLEIFGTCLYAGFAAVIAASTQVMLTMERLREISMLRIIGTRRWKVTRMVLWEAIIIGAGAIAIGGVVGVVVSMPMLGGLPTYVPVTGWLWIAGSGLAVVVAATLLPLLRLLAVRPIDGVVRRS